MRKEYYCTMGQFANRYRHCGPTAMTNLVLTLSDEAGLEREAVFNEVVRIGRTHLAYLNVKNVGGTSDGLSGVYLRAVLKRYGLEGAVVRFGGPATPGRLRAAFQKGALVYLQMHFHPKYHNHHVLMYGVDRDGFRTADGWRAKPTYFDKKDLRGATFFTIQP